MSADVSPPFGLSGPISEARPSRSSRRAGRRPRRGGASGDRVGVPRTAIVAALRALGAVLAAAHGPVAGGLGDRDRRCVDGAADVATGRPARRHARSAVGAADLHAARRRQRGAPCPTGPNVDISAVDRSRRVMPEWAELAKKYETAQEIRLRDLPFGGDRLGRDVLAKAIRARRSRYSSAWPRRWWLR